MSETIRRANTIKLSRPNVWDDIIHDETDLEACAYQGWYILGDIPPNYPVPAIVKLPMIEYISVDGELLRIEDEAILSLMNAI